MNTNRPYSQRIALLFGGIAVAFILTYVVPLLHFGFGESSQLPIASQERLANLARHSLAGDDVPVAAILMYGDSIIGEGYNTVHGNLDAAGHAEVNAISSAMRRFGSAGFARVNRDSLVLISTFEPCLMCTGAILEARIKHVRYLKPKPFLYLLREDLRLLRYRWEASSLGPESLQDSLFLLHWGYRP